MKNFISFRDSFLPLILSGAKTQTRRPVKLRDGSLADENSISNHLDGSFHKVMDFSKSFPYWQELPCKYGNVGDIMEIRDAETRLKIEEIRVEKLQKITEADAVAEGFVSDWDNAGFSAVNLFADVWDDIYGEGSFDSDPFVWVIIFSRC